MRVVGVVVILSLATALGLFTVLTRRPLRMTYGWLGVGFLQSAFFLLVGFELLAIWNALFTLATASVLQLYSALFGTGENQRAECERKRADWIYGLGATTTLGGILGFAISDMDPARLNENELSLRAFAAQLIERFPGLSLAVGFSIFLAIVAWSTIGRPGWKEAKKEKSA